MHEDKVQPQIAQMTQIDEPRSITSFYLRDRRDLRLNTLVLNVNPQKKGVSA